MHKTKFQIVALPFLFCGVFAVVLACSSADLGNKPLATVTVDVNNPTWGNGIQAVLAAKCDNCHAKEVTKFTPENARQYRYDFSGSEANFKAGYLKLVQNSVFNEKPSVMPPNYGTPLSTGEKAALKKYLDTQIAALPTPVPTPVTATTSLTFAGDIKSITDTSCARSGCHSATGGSSFPLTTVAEFKANMLNFSAAENSLGQIESNQMPLVDGTPAFKGSPERLKVLEWLSASPEVK